MGFLFGFLMGSRGPSDSFWRGIFLMLAWGLPLAFGKLVAANAGASLYVPVAFAAYAAMIVFALYRPATSTLKLGLIEGVVMWLRLIAIVFAVRFFWYLYEAHFVLWRATGAGTTPSCVLWRVASRLASGGGSGAMSNCEVSCSTDAAGTRRISRHRGDW